MVLHYFFFFFVFVLLAFLECFQQAAPHFIEKSREVGCRNDNCIGWPSSGNIHS